MFFFFYDGLEEDIIVREAFHNQCFKKIIETGYCDMNIFFNRPRIRKEMILYELEIRRSPLNILYRNNYPKNIEVAKHRLKEVLVNFYEEKLALDEYTEFAIVYYIYKALKTTEEKERFTRTVLEEWQYNASDSDYYFKMDMDLRISSGIIFDNNVVELQIINTMNKYMTFLDYVAERNDKLFFRGHSDVSYKLTPSVFRSDEWFKNEKLMYQELKINCSDDFDKLNGHLEILAEMQHYGLPTRLLDITKNPLVALYFACEDVSKYAGEVIVLGVNRTDIKYPQSDTVAILSSLPLFTFKEQKDFYRMSKGVYPNIEAFNKDIERLVQEVRLERPGFVEKIRQEDLRKSIVVIPARKNRRLEKQEGAFIVCGLLDEKYGTSKQNSIDKMRVHTISGKKIVCIINEKSKLLKQLNTLGINKSKIYPEIDDVADYIKNNVKDL